MELVKWVLVPWFVKFLVNLKRIRRSVPQIKHYFLLYFLLNNCVKKIMTERNRNRTSHLSFGDPSQLYVMLQWVCLDVFLFNWWRLFDHFEDIDHIFLLLCLFGVDFEELLILPFWRILFIVWNRPLMSNYFRIM